MGHKNSVIFMTLTSPCFMNAFQPSTEDAVLVLTVQPYPNVSKEEISNCFLEVPFDEEMLEKEAA